MIKLVRQTLDDKKGESPVILDVRKLSSVTDYYLVCTGNNSRHIKALIDASEQSVTKETGRRPYRFSGSPESEWMILDYLDFVVHVFSQSAREHYALETLWKDAPRVK